MKDFGTTEVIKEHEAIMLECWIIQDKIKKITHAKHGDVIYEINKGPYECPEGGSLIWGRIVVDLITVKNTSDSTPCIGFTTPISKVTPIDVSVRVL